MLFLVPDLALIGYLGGPRAGAMLYNAFHTYLAPAALAALAYAGVLADAWPLCLIWVAHIGLDRALGLGLKFDTSIPRYSPRPDWTDVGAASADGEAFMNERHA